MRNKLKILQLFLFIVLLIIGAIAWLNHKNQENEMVEHIKTLPMKTVCVGRFLIDVPKSAIVTFRNSSISGWDISSREETDSEFQEIENERILLLDTQKNSKDGRMLEINREVKNKDLQGRILVFNRRWLDVYEDGVKNVKQVVAMRADVRIKNITYSLKSDLVNDSDIGMLEDIVGQLGWRHLEEVPSAAGFCINRAIVKEPLEASQAEFTGIFLGFESHPDVAIAFTTMAGIDPGGTLLQRDGENAVKRDFKNRFHVLRAGAREINGISGEEILEQVDEPNGSKLHGFIWESFVKKDDVYLPNLVLELSTGRGKPGNPVDSSLSDSEALMLWEKISASIRVRMIGVVDPATGFAEER